MVDGGSDRRHARGASALSAPALGLRAGSRAGGRRQQGVPDGAAATSSAGSTPTTCYLPGAVAAAVAGAARDRVRPRLRRLAPDRRGRQRSCGTSPPEPFDYRELLEVRNMVAQPAAFFTREAFEAVGGLDPDYHYAMDYDLWLKIAARFEVPHGPSGARGLSASRRLEERRRSGALLARGPADQPAARRPVRVGHVRARAGAATSPARTGSEGVPPPRGTPLPRVARPCAQARPLRVPSTIAAMRTLSELGI